MSDNPTLDDLIQATAEARDVIREMHAATKSLNAAVREARQVTRDELGTSVHDAIAATVNSQLAILTTEIHEAMDKAVNRVYQQIESMADPKIVESDA
jgi:predicted transcriptional regulator